MPSKNITFKDILEQHSNSKIIKRIIEKYPQEEKNKEGYEQALNELRSVRVEYNENIISSSVLSVFIVQSNKDEIPQGITNLSWGYVLGSTPLRGGLDALCNVIYELTFHGFTQKKNDGFWKKLFSKISQIKSNAKI